MATKFRIGYPYASSNPEKTRETVVVLKPLPGYCGFRHIYVDEQSYLLPDTDKGPLVLNGYHQGVVGELIQTKDHRKSIAKQIGQERKIHGEGASSQLALILAACAVYDERITTQLPLLLFSAAIHRPAGAMPFIDATIATYCDAAEVENCLLKKFAAAKAVKASALIVPIRDAKILAAKLHSSWHSIDAISILRPKENPVIIGVANSSLPELAVWMGISVHHYSNQSQREQQPQNISGHSSKMTTRLRYLWGVIIVLLLVFIVGNKFFSIQKNKPQRTPLKINISQKLEPISTEYKKTELSQSKLLEISIVRWIAGGAKAIVDDANSYRLAYIIDPEDRNPESFFWRGTNCILTFLLKVRKQIPRVSLDHISIEGESKALPKYKAKLRFIGKQKPPRAPITTHFYYGEITSFTKKPKKQDEIGHIQLVAQEQGKYILRINAKKPGIYTFSVKLFLSHSTIKEEISLVKSQTWLFDTGK